MECDDGEFRGIGALGAISSIRAGYLERCELNGARRCLTFDCGGHQTKENSGPFFYLLLYIAALRHYKKKTYHSYSTYYSIYYAK